LRVPEIDKLLGIEVYASETPGIGGVIRSSIEDFVVEEVLVDGSVASIEKAAESRVLSVSASRQRYLLCILVKRNWDTFAAIKNIAKQLGIAQEQIQIAGIKDAKAITAQHITIENVSMEEAAAVNVKDIEIRPIGYFRDEMSAYYLLGNKFRITVKAVKLARSTVEKHVAKTIEKLEAIGGIPNFFGHQRFGSTRPITHLTGKAIIQGNFEEAAMLFLAKPSVHEHPSSRKARQELQSTRDYRAALTTFPKQLRYERIMLRHLVDCPGDFVGAFTRLPLKLQELFVQGYQSYLFNRFLSERIKHGFSLGASEVGDYVVNIERSGLPMIRTEKIVTAENQEETNILIKSGRARVALPLVGTKQKLSEGVMGQIERRILEAEGVDKSSFRVDAIPRISGKGQLRALVSPVKNFKIHPVVHSKENLNETQVELSFTLLRGSYATMLLREIMKPPNPIAAGF
jgi:tRNA pseudouridine13 synthase